LNAKREKLNVSKGDTVRVMRGEDKGKEGKVIRVFLKTGRVTIEGVNLVKMHRKARTAEEQSGIREAPASIHSSNVMLLDPKSGEPPERTPDSTPMLRTSSVAEPKSASASRTGNRFPACAERGLDNGNQREEAGEKA